MKTFKKPLSPEEEKDYLARYKEGDMEARNLLIEHNLRLVAHVAKKYESPEHDPDDLISIGIIGLIKAVMTFDSDKNNRLATYAAGVLRILSSRRCVYGSKSIPPKQKRTKVAYSGTGFRECLHPLFYFGWLCEVCTYVYP